MSAGRMSSEVPLSSMGLWFPPLRLLSAFLWHVTEQHLIRYYTRLEEFVSVVVKIVPDLLSAEERAELLLGLRAKFILELCYDQPSVTLQTIQPHLERVSIIAESASTDESGNQIVEAGRTFVNLIKTLLQNPTYRNHFFQDIYQLHYGAKYDKALQLLVWEFLSRLEKFIPVPSFSEAASWLDKDSSALEDALQVIYDTNKIENLLLYLKHSTHMDPGPSSSAILANTILSTLSVCFTAQIVLSPCRQPDECLSTQYDTHCSANDRNADIREENRGDLDEEDKCEEDRDEVDRQGDVDDNNPQKDTSDQVKQKSEIHGHLSQHENSVSNKSGQEVPTSSGEGLGLSPSQDGLLEMGSQSVNTSGEIQYRRNSNRHQTVYKRNHPHTCSYCDKTFKSLSHLKDHIRVHAEERPYGCTVCQMRFVQHSHLEKHSQSHTGERPHVCSYCGKAFKKSSHLKDHICVHTGELPYGCSVCGKRFIQHSNLVVHERKHTSENLECRSDGEVSSSGNEARVSPTQDSRSLEEESQLVNDIAEEQHACTEHGKAFSKATLTTLQKIKTEEMKASQESGADTKLLCHQPNNRVANQAPQHACSECGRVFIYKRCLIKHQTNHPSQNPHLCSYCGKAFEKKGHLKDHIRIHTGEQPYACSVCGEKFSQRTKRIAHERLHTSEDPVSMSKEEVVRSSGNEARVPLPQANLFEEESQLVKTADDCAHQPNNIVGNNSERPYNCVVCGRRFAQRSHLVIHNRLHTGEKPYLCSYCGKAFRQRSGLQSHIRVHTGERPYSCSVCGKRFIQPSSLTAHKRQHTGERPYLCSVCGKCFPVKGALSVHMRIHTGELPHKCEFCGKGFRVSCHLAVHRRVHTREKPYNCSVCEKKFSSHVAIGRHMRTHTGEKPYECLQCGIRFSNKYNMRVHQRVHR